MVFLFLMLVNKPIKFKSKANHTYFFYKKKDRYVLHTRFTFHIKFTNQIYKEIIEEKKKSEKPKNKFIHEFVWNFLIP
jgi:hypothetical protein